jgi:hypothetical protein
VACIGKRNTYGILVGKREGRRPLGGPDIDGRIYKMVLKEIECEGVEGVNLT